MLNLVISDIVHINLGAVQFIDLLSCLGPRRSKLVHWAVFEAEKQVMAHDTNTTSASTAARFKFTIC